jgi:hypothetical protein
LNEIVDFQRKRIVPVSELTKLCSDHSERLGKVEKVEIVGLEKWDK